jgi:hypothetical protein
MTILTSHPRSEHGRLRTVVLYGNSLAVTTFGASLQGTPGVCVQSMDANLSDPIPRLQELKPDIVMFDLATAHPGFAISLWKVHPHLLLIGVDLPRGEILLLAGSRQQVLNVTDLIEVIRGDRQSIGTAC